MGWGLLNDLCKSMILFSFQNQTIVLFPDLFPGFDIATPVLRRGSRCQEAPLSDLDNSGVCTTAPAI